MLSTERIINNIQKYAWLVGAFALAAWLGSLWLGIELTLWFLAIGSLLTIISMNRIPTQILRIQGATKLNPYERSDLQLLVNDLARKAGLKVQPEVFVLKSNQMNAFAMGTKKRPVIGISYGLLNQLNGRELKGVIAHEISHIKNGDLFVKGMARSFGQLTNMLSWVARFLLLMAFPLWLFGVTMPIMPLILMLFAPGLNWLLQMGLSRSMEFLADHDAGIMTKDPMGLANALHKIDRLSRPWWLRLNPIVLNKADWLSSHPNTRSRIEKLKVLSAQFPGVDYDQYETNQTFEPFRPVFYRTPYGITIRI